MKTHCSASLKYIIIKKFDDAMDPETRKIVTKNEHTTDEKLNLIYIEELNNRINKSEENFKKGRYKTTSELIEKYKL